MVVAKMAEFYDPLGIFEPFKLQLKLEVSKLNGMEWDQILPDDLQFLEFLHNPEFQHPAQNLAGHLSLVPSILTDFSRHSKLPFHKGYHRR